MELSGKNVLVVGLADSGLAAARFLVSQGARVTVTDKKSASELAAAVKRLAGLEIDYALGGHPESVFTGADLVVVSPGVPKALPQFDSARGRGVPVLSELELAARHLKLPLLAVTGTNGKSTAVALLGEIMKADRGADRVFVGGNIGTPLVELAASPGRFELAVVEVSSFQLEFSDTFNPRVAALLNVTPDHLDRYRDFDEYAEYKRRLFANQSGEDFAVMNVDDPVVESMIPGLAARVMTVSLQRAPARGMWLTGEELVYCAPGEAETRIPVREIPLHGRHNLVNVMVASCMALAIGVKPEVIRQTLAGFRGLDHRFELVREYRGRRFFDDSKATNAGAVAAAVSGLDRPVILLMGGQAKGCVFDELARSLGPRVKSVVAFGECRGQLRSDFDGLAPVAVVETLAEAVAEAYARSAEGDAILLAPGCASFDQFRNYKHRGDVFQRLVREIA